MLPYNRKDCKGVSYTIFRPILDLIFCTFSRLLSPPFRVNMGTTKGKKPETTEENQMNAKTEQQIANLKTQTIGVEIEMNHITRKNAAKLAADFFGTGRYEDTAHRNGYYTWSAWDAEEREWNSTGTVSIAGADSEKCELVTPILHYEDIEILQELVRSCGKPERFPTPELVQAFTSTSERMGTHRKPCEISPTLWRAMNG